MFTVKLELSDSLTLQEPWLTAQWNPEAQLRMQ